MRDPKAKPKGVFAGYVASTKTAASRKSMAEDLAEMAAAKVCESIGQALFSSGAAFVRRLREDERHRGAKAGVFASLQDNFGEFPLYLVSPPAVEGGLFRHSSMRLSLLLTKFHESAVYTRFLALAGGVDRDSLNGRSFAAVFPCAGINRGLLVAHAISLPSSVIDGLGSLFLYRIPGDAGGYVYCCPFTSYLKHLKSTGFRLD